MEFKIAFRNLLKRPFLNVVKIAGLCLGLCGTVIILLFILNQLSYDKWNANADRIYRLTTTGSGNFADKHFAKVFDSGFLPAMSTSFPEIESYVRLVPVLGGVIKHDEKFINLKQGFQCDSTFFNVFNVGLISGNKNALSFPGSMVISQSFASRVFGKADPIGQVLTLPEGQFYNATFDFIVRGVMDDFPQNSHLHPEFIVSPSDKNELGRVAWTYLLLHDNANPDNLVNGFPKFYSTSVNNDIAQQQVAHLQKLTDIHLYSNKLREIEPNSSITVIYTLGIAALLLLTISIINFANLSIGMTVFSEKYLRFSKILGSSPSTVIRYFFYESSLVGMAAMMISGVIITLADQVIATRFSLHLLRDNWQIMIMAMLAFGVVITFSAIVLSVRRGAVSFNLKNTNNSVVRRKNISVVLVVFQNTISICLIVAVIVIYRQTDYALSSSMGFESNNLICFENVHSDVQKKFETFKSELLKSSSITSVSAMLDRPGGEANDMMPFTLDGYTPATTNMTDTMIGVLPCDYSLAGVFGLSFLSGTNFSEKNEDSDGSGEYIINESALNKLGYQNAEDIVGKEFSVSFDPSISIPKGRIIGVVKDFHLSNLRKKIEPLVLFKRKDIWLLNFIVAFQPGRSEEALSELEVVWKRMFPSHPMEFAYVDELYKDVYQTELLEANLLSLFTVAALFISAMGLLGLSILTTQRRMKEIAIRKINGADVYQLITMLSWNFIKWIMLAFVLAVPLSYYAMNQWLGVFAYKTQISWWIFVIAGIASILVAFMAVFLQSFSATTTNPIEVLRHD